jgi:hypothetical protein
MNGLALAESAEAALAVSQAFALSDNLGILIGAGAVIELQTQRLLAA